MNRPPLHCTDRLAFTPTLVGQAGCSSCSRLPLTQFLSHRYSTASWSALTPSTVFHSQCAWWDSALAMRGGFHASQHLIEVGAAKVLAVHYDGGNLLGVGNVF